MAATLALDPLVRPGIEQQRHLVEVLQEMEEPGRDLEQTLSLDLVEGSREEGTRHLHLDQGRVLPKDQGILQENQEVEEVESKVEEGKSKVEEGKSKVEEGESKVEVAEDKVEVVEKPLPALEKNCRLASTSALDSMRASLAPVWQDVQSVALSDPSQDLNRSMHHNVPLLQPSTQEHPNQPLL